MTERAFSAGVVATLFTLCAGCSDFWGEGSDPSRAGPYEGPLSSGGSGGNGPICNPSPCGSGNTGNTGTGNVGTVIASNLGSNVNDMEVDGDYLYYTTGQGLARVLKDGSETPEGLGGFMQASGLAVRDGAAFLVDDSGGVVRVNGETKQKTTVVPAGPGGGSGSIQLDGANMFFTTGPYVRRAPFEGGTATRLIDGLITQGGPSGNRLCVDSRFVYFVAGVMAGSGSQIRSTDKNAPGVLEPGMGGPGGGNQQNQGVLVVSGQGAIAAIVADGDDVYYSDSSSDGISPKVEIYKLNGADTAPSRIASVAAGANSGGSYGAALVTDGQHLYFTGPRGLYRVAVEGGPVDAIDEYALTTALAVDDQFVFWADQNQSGTLRRLQK